MHGLFVSVTRRKRPLSKKNMTAQARFAKMHLNKSQDFQNNIFWTDKTKIEMFGHSTTFNEISAHINYQHGDGGVMSWACFTTRGSGHLAVTDST